MSARRDPLADRLITPQSAAMVVIDYQPSQIAAVRSMDPGLVLENIVSTVTTAKAFRLPIVHSTVNVASDRGRAQRGWARQETVADVVQIVLTGRLLEE